ncbi:hypothetical protein [Roseivirga sp. UBA838]|uniref:hypothetical protein n=1 Tax=Roseivirga sp. UBA838 TaxID=1947393 RepID=UPI00257E6613|nr:hypothetical protein [Roseivirga sp. UBA838]|tara:strand:- start:7005 stop:7418 length:414 start_codon:yes stop_codon:yes gene_type:complete
MAEISRIKKKIREYMEYHGLSEYEFCKRTGIAKGVINSETGISEQNFYRFLEYDPAVSILWLIYDKGDMYGKYSIQGEPSQVSEPEEIYPKNKAKHDNLIHSIDNEISSLIKLSENHLEILKETRKYFTNLKHTSKL